MKPSRNSFLLIVYAAFAASPALASPCVSVSAPAKLVGNVALKTKDICVGKWYETLYVDGSAMASFAVGQVTLDSMTLSNGAHKIYVTSQSQSNPTSTTLGTSHAITVHVANPASYPITDAEAAEKVVNSQYLPSTESSNSKANHRMPSTAQLATYLTRYNQGAAGSALDSTGLAYMSKVTGHYKGTTDEILQWAAQKWGFDPNLARANAVTETHWIQDGIGDILNGVSLGILQIKSRDYAGTCDYAADNLQSDSSASDIQSKLAAQPQCLSYNYTAWAADFRYAWQRACYDKHNNWYKGENANYLTDTGDTLLWGCVGAWYSGSYYDGSASYISSVQGYLNTIVSAPTTLQGLQNLGL